LLSPFAISNGKATLSERDFDFPIISAVALSRKMAISNPSFSSEAITHPLSSES